MKKLLIITAVVVGFLLFLISVVIASFFISYSGKIYPGVKIDGLAVSGKTVKDAQSVWTGVLAPKDIVLEYKEGKNWVLEGKLLEAKYNADLTAKRAYDIGRENKDLVKNLRQIIYGFTHGYNLTLDIKYNEAYVNDTINSLAAVTDIPAQDALFEFKNGKVTVFRLSENGQAIDKIALRRQIESFLSPISLTPLISPLSPKITTDHANSLGIKELLAKGESYFYDSIPGRVHNIETASKRFHGVIIEPDEIFSFNKILGEVSSFTGFQKAYVILEGKTVLGDGGGVCQVSTTMFRAALNAGLAIKERLGHTYRVGFYEQGGFLPGIDATVYSPSPDFKFQNNTGNYLLIQTIFDKTLSKLTFELYGTSDNRQITLAKPQVYNITAPPPAIYEDTPNLPVGKIQQTDTAHAGATTSFKRTVVKDGQTLIDEVFTTHYIPWPARYLRGTR